MAIKALFLLGLLIVHVSCRQNSLTFVIDDTGSMYDDIRQVKSAAKSIMDIVLKEKTSQIEDIVLVTFNDPGTRLRKKTRDAKELRQALDSINVGGGGDCEEMSLSGIKKGLEESRPGSYVYVFTDASSKDYSKFAEVKTLCQEKQSQIVFVLTGHCNDRDRETYKVYRKLATASNGQVFDISKNEVGQVLEYVKETIKGDRTVIGTATIPANQWRDIKFNIDDQTEYAIVSASGRNVKLNVQRNTYTVAGVRITWTSNVKVFKLTNLTPGTYTARVWGNSEVNIMVFGRTDFNFQHGFSTEVKNSLAATDPQPTTGVETHLLVSVQDKTHSANIRQVELRDMDDRVIMTLPLTFLTGDLYFTNKFLPPQKTFKIAVVATSSKSGNTIKRVAKTPVTPIQSVAPEIYKRDKIIKVKEGGSVDLRCGINKGKPMPQITWYVKKQGAAGFTQLTGTDDVIHVTNALTNDQYKCMAKNVAGHDEHTLQLDVQVAPKFPSKHDALTKKEGEPATIDCKLHKGNPAPKIQWQFKPRDGSYKPMSYEGNVLSIVGSQLSHSGHYRCVANNDEGWDEKITELVVQVAPEIYKRDKIIKVKEGGSVDLRCRMYKGMPMPQITWYVKKQGAAGFTQLTGTDDVIHVTNALTNDQYKCMAKNVAGHDEHTLQLDVQVAPKFPNKHDVMSRKEGESATIDCKLHKGNPAPKIQWQFKPRDGSYKPMSYEGNVLSIVGSQLSHSGHYRCVANNDEGWDEKITELVVQAKPAVEKLPDVQSVMENTPVNLHCRVTTGFPKPTVNWFYKSPHSTKYESNNTDHIYIGKVKLSHAGLYKCVAENEVGRREQVVQLVVNAPPRIVISTNEYIAVEGDVAIRVPCTAVGHPVPTITWKVDEQVIGTDKSKRLYVDGNALLLQHPKSADSTNKTHSYVCHAANKFGSAVQEFQVFVDEYIDFKEPNETHYGLRDQPFDVICPLPFKDPSSVRWYKDYEGLNITGAKLHFASTNITDSGNYTCRVSDMTGKPISQTIQVIFGQPPKNAITSFDIEWPTQEEKKLSSNLDTNPIPDGQYEWFYNGQKIENADSDSLAPIGWGEYTCRVSNPFGNVLLTWKVTSHDKECGINKSLLKKYNAPITLDSSLSWPELSSIGQYIIVPHSEKLQLFCPGVNSVKTTSSNGFTKFPALKSVYATCDHEDYFLVDGVPRKFSELDCKHRVTPSVVPTRKLCLGQDTELMRVGFHVNGFTDVYQSCVDKTKNVPLYTKMNTIPIEDRYQSSPSMVKTGKQLCLDKCCYENIQLVSAEDVSFGPAEKATFIDSLNYVNYCKPINGTNWQHIEKIGRDPEQLTVWSGATQYTKIGNVWTPKYLWKVLKETDRSEKVVVIHENVNTPSPKLCSGKCGVEFDWFEPWGDRTYCCSLADFKTAFGVNIDFDEH